MSLYKVVFDKDSNFCQGQAAGVRALGTRGVCGVPGPPCAPAAQRDVSLLLGLGFAAGIFTRLGITC